MDANQDNQLGTPIFLLIEFVGMVLIIKGNFIKFLGIINVAGLLLGGGIGLTSAILHAPVWGTLFSLVIVGIFILVVGPQAAAQHILATGVSAEAKILEVRETGITINKLDYIVNFVLEVRPKGLPPYKTKTRGMLSRLTMAQFQAGNVVPVKYDPKNPKKVALVERTSAY